MSDLARLAASVAAGQQYRAACQACRSPAMKDSPCPGRRSVRTDAVCGVAPASSCECLLRQRGIANRGIQAASCRLKDRIDRTGLVGFLKRPHRAGDETMVCQTTLEEASTVFANVPRFRGARFGDGALQQIDRNFASSSCATKVAPELSPAIENIAISTRVILRSRVPLPFLLVTSAACRRHSSEIARSRFPLRRPADGPITSFRVSHGQQNAHRRIASGRDPGGGATR